MINKRVTDKTKKVIKIIAALIFVISLFVSWVLPEQDLLPFAKEVLPQAQSFQKVTSSPLIYEGIVQGRDGKTQRVGYVVIDRAVGYSGPIQMATGIDLEGKIQKTVLVNYKDTPSFVQTVLSRDYLKRFIGKDITEPLSIEKDIDRVSGATYTSRGIAKAISQGSHAVARTEFKSDVLEEEAAFKFGAKEIIVLLLVILMLIGIVLKSKKIRWVTLIGSLIFIGFKYNTPFSLANVAALLMGNFPSIRENLAWYIVMVGIPIITFVVGRNLYCYWLCPFGALQEILSKLGGGSFKCCNKKIETNAAKIKYALVYFALLASILFQSPGLAGYEPYSTLFGLQGFGIAWIILPLVLFPSLLIRRFWCHFFCPGMVFNEFIIRLRSLNINKMINKKTTVLETDATLKDEVR
ncbi:MAG: putative electron transport protein YccM [Candidatus Dichloromethanomonas elyunquensis]|nr:MAG: putative electron transport protein YccM [Candidatus Dichloromethanomonas elyunquensis]